MNLEIRACIDRGTDTRGTRHGRIATFSTPARRSPKS
jgi:hypothetical protein